MKTTIKNGMTNAQRRRLFWIFNEIGFDSEARHDFVSDFTDGRMRSLADVDFITAREMIRYLDECLRSPQARKRDGSLDRKRKGVMRAIFAYLEKRGIETPSMDYVKGIAVRAAGIAQTGIVSHDFNRISGAALTRIYNEFCSKQTVQKEKAQLNND